MKIHFIIFFVFLSSKNVFAQNATSIKLECSGRGSATSEATNEKRTKACAEAAGIVQTVLNPDEVVRFSAQLQNLGSIETLRRCEPTLAYASEITGQVCDGKAADVCMMSAEMVCVYKYRKFPMQMHGACRSENCKSFRTCMNEQKLKVEIKAFPDVKADLNVIDLRVDPTGHLEINR